jgi:PTH1 family peptidyl-tRNA hydrolase
MGTVDVMHLIVGLGNPGRKYERTRHNIGFRVVDRLAERWHSPVSGKQLGALVSARAKVGEGAVLLAKPQSFMNRSGQPTVSLKGYYKVDATAVVVIHDDLDIPFGQLRVKSGGGHGGHNGLRDIKRAFGDQDFIRVRCGVSRPPAGWATADYVLGRWTDEEEEVLPSIVERAAEVAACVVKEGATAAMNQFNGL